MKEKHRQWLKAFLKNCQDSNKSPKTIINYRIDLQHFILWFERTQKGHLNTANAQTISEYKSYISDGKLLFSSKTKEKISKANSFMGKITGMLQFVFKRKKSKKNKLLAQIIPDELDLPALTPAAAQPGLMGSSAPVLSMAQQVPLNRRPLAVASRRRHLSAIKNFYEFLKQSNEDVNDLFVNNPVKSKLHGIKLKEDDVESTKLLTLADWKCIEESAFRPKESFVVHLLYLGGLRLAELSHLRVKDFDHHHYTIKFVRKGGYVHTLHIQNHEMIFSLLQKYINSRRSSSEYLFINKFGNPISPRSMYTFLMKIFQKAGCPTEGLTPHSFRKACATNLYHDTKDLLLVRDYLNHADAKVTQTYIDSNARLSINR